MFLTESQDKHFIFCIFKNWVLDKISLTATKEVIILIIIGLLEDTMIAYDTLQRFFKIWHTLPQIISCLNRV